MHDTRHTILTHLTINVRVAEAVLCNSQMTLLPLWNGDSMSAFLACTLTGTFRVTNSTWMSACPSFYALRLSL